MSYEHPRLSDFIKQLNELNEPKPLDSYRKDPHRCLQLMLCWWKDREQHIEDEQ